MTQNNTFQNYTKLTRGQRNIPHICWDVHPMPRISITVLAHGRLLYSGGQTADLGGRISPCPCLSVSHPGTVHWNGGYERHICIFHCKLIVETKIALHRGHNFAVLVIGTFLSLFLSLHIDLESNCA